MSVVAGRPSRGPLARHAGLVRRSAAYELQKAAAFRVGFLLRELLRGLPRAAVMIFVYHAMTVSAGVAEIRGFAFMDFVHYLLFVAVLDKLIFPERGMELSDQIFEGHVTKFLVMPFHYFALALGRFTQFVLLQLAVVLVVFGVGASTLHAWWPPWPGGLAVVEALTLTLLGSYCFFLTVFCLNCLAFWFDVVWTLLVMWRFVATFVAGLFIPVSLMPSSLQSMFSVLFPYWTLYVPVEILLGRRGGGDFVHGLVVLGASIVVLQALALLAWRRGLLRYTGSGM